MRSHLGLLFLLHEKSMLFINNFILFDILHKKWNPESLVELPYQLGHNSVSLVKLIYLKSIF